MHFRIRPSTFRSYVVEHSTVAASAASGHVNVLDPRHHAGGELKDVLEIVVAFVMDRSRCAAIRHDVVASMDVTSAIRNEDHVSVSPGIVPGRITRCHEEL